MWSTVIGWVRVAAHRGVIMPGRFSASWRVRSHDVPPCPTMMPARMTVTGTPAAARSFPPRSGCARAPAGCRCRRRARRGRCCAAARPRRRLAECCRGGGILAPEVRVAERVHQVVGRPAASHRGMQRSRGVDVAVDGRARSGITGGVAGHGGDVVAGFGQGRAEPPADETGCAGDKYPGRSHLVAGGSRRDLHVRSSNLR